MTIHSARAVNRLLVILFFFRWPSNVVAGCIRILYSSSFILFYFTQPADFDTNMYTGVDATTCTNITGDVTHGVRAVIRRWPLAAVFTVLIRMTQLPPLAAKRKNKIHLHAFVARSRDDKLGRNNNDTICNIFWKNLNFLTTQIVIDRFVYVAYG